MRCLHRFCGALWWQVGKSLGKKGGKKGKKAAGEESSEEDSSEEEDLGKMDKYARIKAENIKKMAALSKGKAAGPGQPDSSTAIQNTHGLW